MVLDRSVDLPRHLIALLATLTIASVAAGCGHKDATPSPAPTPTPTPSVVSVARQFQAAISSSRFQFDGRVTGTMTAVINGSDVQRGLTGRFLYKAGDYSWQLTTELGTSKGADSETATIEYRAVGKFKYVRDESGHWSRSPRPGGTRAYGLGGVFFISRKLEDLGLDTFRGQDMHKLQWADGPGLRSSLVDFQGDDDVSGMMVRVNFWADAKGKPVGVSYRIDVPATTGRSQTEQVWLLDVQFTDLSGIKIVAPM